MELVKEVLSWYDFAEIFEIRNIDISKSCQRSEEYKELLRPTYSVLDNFMLKLVGLNSFRNWKMHSQNT